MLKKLLIVLICFSLCFCGVGSTYVGEPTKVSAANTSVNEDKQRLAELQNKLNGIKNNINNLEQKKENINTETQTILAQKLLLEEEYSLLSNQIDTIAAIMAEYESIMDKIEEERKEKEKELKKQLDEFGTLLVELYKNGDDSKFDIFLQSDSYSSYISYVEYMEHILKSSDTMITDINDTITAIEERKNDYAEASAKLKEKETELEAAKLVLDGKSAEMDQKLEELKENLPSEDDIAAMEKDEQDLLKEIEQLKQQIQDKLNASSGKFSWPFASNVSYYISSPFGWRDNPFVSGRKEFHNGIDIVCAKGTAIRAVDAGIVTYSGYRGAFGNVVFVEHGGGYTTIYAHCDSLLVTAGTKVLKDQAIARVGATGQVTGVHLHFAVSKNGSYVDPAKYLPSAYLR